MKKMLNEMQNDNKIPLNSIETIKKFANYFSPRETIKIVFQYLLRLFDIYNNENNQNEKLKVLEYLKYFCFNDDSLNNFNKNFDFPKPLNNAFIDNHSIHDNNKTNVIKSELTKEMISLLYPQKIIEMFNKTLYDNKDANDSLNTFGINQNPNSFGNQNNNSNLFGSCFGSSRIPNTNNNNFQTTNIINMQTTNLFHNLNKKINKSSLELLKTINPFYLDEYLDSKIMNDENLFANFLQSNDPFYLAFLLYKNAKDSSEKKIEGNTSSDNLLSLIRKFMNNILVKRNHEEKPEVDYLKLKFMEKISKFITLEQVEILINDLENKKIPTDVIHENFWYDLLLNKKFKNEKTINLSDEEKYNFYEKILNFISNKNSKKNFPIFKTFILLGILDLNCKLNNYNISYFIEYIESPFYSVNEPYSEIYKNCIKKRDYIINNELNYGFFTHSFLDSVILKEKEILEKHLFYYFVKKNIKYEKFDEILQEKFLKKIYYKAKIYKGLDKDSEKSSLNNSVSSSFALEESSSTINKEDFSLYFSKSEFDYLVKKTELNILKLNKYQYNIKDEVKIEIEFKNIQNLILKIFELNTENYYYNSKKAFDSSINLEGLIPFQEEIYVFNEKQEKLITKNFLIDKIPNKRGVYIVEFIGKGLSARAIIKKGNLKLITKMQSKGVNFFILDEENNICKPVKDHIDENNQNNPVIDPAENQNEQTTNEKKITDNHDNQEESTEVKTGIWYNNEFFKADKTGLIIIPYNNNNNKSDFSCIISHKGFSEFAKLNIDKESYTLKGYFFTEDETLLAGNTTKFIVKPFLFLNDLESKNFLLQKIKVTATIKNEVNGEIIPANKIWEKVKLNEFFEFNFDLQIPSKVTSIHLTFEAEVYSNSKKIFEKLKFEEEFKININYPKEQNIFSNYVLSQEMRKIFLKKNYENKYSLFVLGKNGEPIKNTLICLKLFHRHLNFSDIKLDFNADCNFNICSEIENNFTQLENLLKSKEKYSRENELFSIICKMLCLKRIFLQTDSNGEIKLGDLCDFRYLITYLFVEDEKTIQNANYEIWNLENDQRFNYPSRIDKLENECIHLPISKRKIASKEIEGLNEKEFLKNLILIQVFEDGEVYKFLNDKITLLDLNSIKENINNNEFIEIRKVLKLNNLQKGNYKIILANENTIIYLYIHEGSYWASNDFIINKKYDYVCENTETHSLPLIEDLKINLKENSIKIKVNSSDLIMKNSSVNETNSNNIKKSLRVHLFAYNFIKNESFIYMEKFNKANENKITFSNQKLTNSDSLFLESKSLNEEIQYVLERKNYEKLMGNSLEKPTLLMKKNFRKRTSNEINHINKGTEYKNQEIRINNYNIEKIVNIKGRRFNSGKQIRIIHSDILDNYALNYLDSNNDFIDESINFKKSNFNECSTFKNFLFDSSKLIIDIPFSPGEEKQITIQALSEFSFIQIICTENHLDGTKFNCFEELIALKDLKFNNIKGENLSKKDNLNVKFKDISLLKTLDLNQNYTELRICEIINKETEYIIEDIFNNNYKLIDSLEKVINFQTYFLNDNNNEMKKKLEEYKFIFEFDKLSLEKQKEKISQYFSNEFNFYIFMKFPKIFEELILPIIRLKIDRNFIDYFLLNDEENIKKFLNLKKYKNMLLIEKCLLIKFISLKDQSQAKKLANNLKENNDNILDKILFDLVVHSKVDSNQSKGNDFDDFVIINEINNNNDNNLFGNQMGFIQIPPNVNEQTNLIQQPAQQLQMQSVQQPVQGLFGGFSNSSNNQQMPSIQQPNQGLFGSYLVVLVIRQIINKCHRFNNLIKVYLVVVLVTRQIINKCHRFNNLIKVYLVVVLKYRMFKDTRY